MTDYQRYIDFIFQPDDLVELRLIGDNKPVKKIWRRAGEKLDVLYLRLQNALGYNIYIGVNPRRATNHSGDGNIMLARFIFADFDGIEPGGGCGIWDVVEDRIYQSGIGMPDLSVFSGHGIHCYWRLAEPLRDWNRWRKLQNDLARALGGDAAICNPERLLRLPGFKNVKKHPVQCFIL